MDIDILSLFPDYFESPFRESILKKAQEKELLSIRQVQIRDFAKDKHRKVDDRPYGGGPGMVMKPGPVCEAIRSVKRDDSYVIYLSPQGEKLGDSLCREIAVKKHLILLCGYYEGIDERILKEVHREISIGDYVLTNGGLAAIVFVDAVARFIPGVLGNKEAADQDSFSQGVFDHPHYTRPEIFEGEAVPSVLLEGNHAEIEAWRKRKALEKTRRIRPELLKEII